MTDRDHAEELLREGVELFEAGHFERARASFSRAHLISPQLPAARFWVAVAQYHLGNVGEAREHLEPLLDSPPPLPDRPGAVHEYVSRCYLGTDPEKALSVAVAGAEKDPADPRLRVVAGNAYMRLASARDALAQYDLAWELEGGSHGVPAFPPKPGLVPFSRSSALVALSRWQEALEAIKAALAREPENGYYHDHRGIILRAGLNDPGRALDAALRAIQLDPQTLGSGGDGSYHYHAALCLQALDRRLEAVEALDRALAISPQARYRELKEQLLHPVQTGGGPERPYHPGIDYSHVGGMHGLKEQVRRIMDVVFERREDAARYGISRNGILLYGPPGCGKTFFARATAGEFGLAFRPVNLGSALTKWVGAAAEPVERIFAEAREQLPCLLFFDEFDAIATRRDEAGSHHEQQQVNALLQQIDANRDVPGLVIAAATNRIDELDPAIIREGRFDFKVKIYRPDFDARREILLVLLAGRPHDPLLDATELAHAMEGFSAARIRHVVDAAAMAAMEALAPIDQDHLFAALRGQMQHGRFAGPGLRWEDLILPAETLHRLQFIERFMEHPELVRELGIEPPTGALLHGPPGTGKTTIARVLASETDASFYAVNAADIFSKWVGDSEKRVRQLFERARDNVPALIFIDEIESILGHRVASTGGADRTGNAVVNTFLAEMDGIAGTRRIFVIGATNRPDLVDDAVLRPGRLGEVIEIGLPDEAGRLALLQLFTRDMKLLDDVDLAVIAAAAEGASGADLRGLCTAAGRAAFLREFETGGTSPAVTPQDFASGLRELFPADWAQERRIGFRTPAS